MPYTGRFAPSPTGRLHLGSLVAAVGSFLDARHGGGRWLVRMEDLDPARVVPGAADDILRSLESLGLAWDGSVEYQSRRLPLYRAALERLHQLGLTFECSCPRSARGAAEQGYPGTCRDGPTRPGPTATRVRVDRGAVVAFDDRVQGPVRLPLDRLGDVLIRRRDGVYAYQLAVVVDDGAQQVSDVVRGADLLDSTGWQIPLQQALGLPQPRYAHLPLIVSEGVKLAKSRASLPAEPTSHTLFGVLKLLRQDPPAQLHAAPVATLLEWAVQHWNPAPLRGVPALPDRPALSN
ncbi:MAG TPA: tRNA glutamyl-Q(34) synthetase GluQRS [Steroidobacteraceae bacterium]|nr:tRNA glutamyl-Q(34) synthetase GluQRS [Steroidobacteraceae bacterium]